MIKTWEEEVSANVEAIKKNVDKISKAEHRMVLVILKCLNHITTCFAEGKKISNDLTAMIFDQTDYFNRHIAK